VLRDTMKKSKASLNNLFGYVTTGTLGVFLTLWILHWMSSWPLASCPPSRSIQLESFDLVRK